MLDVISYFVDWYGGHYGQKVVEVTVGLAYHLGDSLLHQGIN